MNQRMKKNNKGILVTLAVVLLFGFSVAGCAKKPAQPGPGEQMTQTRAAEETPDTPGGKGAAACPRSFNF